MVLLKAIEPTVNKKWYVDLTKSGIEDVEHVTGLFVQIVAPSWPLIQKNPTSASDLLDFIL